MGDTISALTRHAKETASQNMPRCGSKNDSSKRLGRSVMSRCGIRQQIRFVLILFSLWQYVETYFAEPDTIFGVCNLLEELGGGTRLAMPKTICAPDSSSLKPGSGATEGVLD